MSVMEALALVPDESEPEITTKVCANCKTEKSTDLFQRDRTHSDGYKSSCKACRNGKRTAPQKKQDDQQAILNRAQNEAAKKLIDNHIGEFRHLVAAQLGLLGYKPKWRSVK